MNPLGLRKQLLIAESELNRTQLVGELAALRAGVHSLTGRAKSLGSITSAAALLLAGLATFRRGNSGSARAKSSWLQKILKGGGMVSTLWLAYRTYGQGPDPKPPELRA